MYIVSSSQALAASLTTPQSGSNTSHVKKLSADSSYIDSDVRPSDDVFLKWAKQGKAELITDALQRFPDLVDVKDREVSCYVQSKLPLYYY